MRHGRKELNIFKLSLALARPKPARLARTMQQGAVLVEWLFVITLFVVILTSFFTLALPKIQAYSAKTVIETALLDKISMTPPQLGVISGAGDPINGITPLNLIDPAGFDQRVENFFCTLKSSVDPELRSYGFDPNDFEYCLVLKFQGNFETELVAGNPAILTRSSLGLGVRCSGTLESMLTSSATTQWAFNRSLLKWPELSLIKSAYANPVSQEFIAIVGARDSAEKVCPIGACIAAGPVAGLEEPLIPPDATPTPEETPTPDPTATPEETATQAPTAEPTPPPVDTEIPVETPTQVATEVATTAPENTATSLPTETPLVATPTPEETLTPAASETPEETPSQVPTTEPTPLPVDTATSLPTGTPLVTSTVASTPTAQNTATNAATASHTPGVLPSATATAIATNSPAPTQSPLPTPSPVPSRTPILTPVPTRTSSPVATNTQTQLPTNIPQATTSPLSQETLIAETPSTEP